MSSRINLGDGELGHSLSSWISDHLGGKSYITDNANQSHSLPSKDKLSEKYSFPSGIQLRILGEGEMILSTRSGEVAFYEASFHASLRKSCNTLPALIEDEAKRTAEVLGKIELGGYFDMSKVLSSRTFKKHFALGRMECGIPSRSNSVEYLGVIRGDIGRIARRALPNINDLTLLRWLKGKVKNPFSNLFPNGLSSSSDSKSKSLSNLGISPELRSNAMLSQINVPLKAIIIQEKRTQEDVHDPTVKKGKVDDLKGKEAMPPPQSKRTKSNKGAANAVGRLVPGGPTTLLVGNLSPGASIMSSALVARKVLDSAILPTDKEKVDQFATNELVTKSFHALGQLAHANTTELELVKTQNLAFKAEGQLANLGKKAMKTEAELKEKSEAMARLEAEVAELTGKLAQAKELALDEFKFLNEFKDAVADAAATYFGKDFIF
ncbi:hypothetical protein Acr_00g0017830 [Actinidia rufa]|uniref:Uncharacterized protein n=1 Tax=Actinidia rufa TaxID=165716 RepID=A0A7J0DD52_9ERIC|nr:hypothetical protein Acr_00g0017830 [Actinidia rufa]